jgi:TRAP-type C4-dicarboxylate transport system substrate-binding protein
MAVDMKRWIFAGLLFGAALVGAHAQTLKMRIGSPVGPTDVGTTRMQALAEDIRKRTGGRLELEVVAIETIGFKNVDSLRVLKQSVLEGMMLLPYYLGRDVPQLANFAPHGVMVEPADNLKIMEVQREIADGLYRKAGVVPAMPWFIGSSELRDIVIVSKFPVRSLDDLKGKKLRHFTPDGVRAFNALGIATQNVPSSELYLALKTGVVDAAVYGNTYIQSQSIYETTCCVTYLAPFSAAFPATLAFTPAAWERLDGPMRDAIKAAGEADMKRAVAEWQEGKGEKASQAFLESKGMKFQPPLPMEDRRRIQAELLKAWREQSEKLGPEALKNFDLISSKLRP